MMKIEVGEGGFLFDYEQVYLFPLLINGIWLIALG